MTQIWFSKLFQMIYCIFITYIPAVIAYEHVEQCTYFAAYRVAEPQSGLSNCTWYKKKSCCRRTEVTSVFKDMLPLYQSTTGCHNRMNYLQCYFCSPYQQNWYNKKAIVCKAFCNELYEHCAGASYNGTRIGEAYKNGEEFCEAQNFKVVDSETGCFAYDPTQFQGSPLTTQSHMSLLLLLMCVQYIISAI